MRFAVLLGRGGAQLDVDVPNLTRVADVSPHVDHTVFAELLDKLLYRLL